MTGVRNARDLRWPNTVAARVDDQTLAAIESAARSRGELPSTVLRRLIEIGLGRIDAVQPTRRAYDAYTRRSGVSISAIIASIDRGQFAETLRRPCGLGHLRCRNPPGKTGGSRDLIRPAIHPQAQRGRAVIIRSSFRGPGGLADHLQRVDTNEKVLVRPDLSPDGADNVEGTLSDYVAIVGALRGPRNSLLHIAVSPTRALSLADELTVIDRIRAAYGIAPDHAMLAVQHTKPGETDRPAHYHFIFPRLDFGDQRDPGRRPRAISDSFSKIKNERLSVELGYDLRHAIVPGPHIDQVRARLAVERPDMTEILAHLKPLKDQADGTTVADKAAAFGADLDLREFDQRVLEAYEVGDFEAAKLTLSRGDKTILVVDDATGTHHSLIRVLRREVKRRGRSIDVTEATLEQRLGTPTLSVKDAKRAGLDRELRNSRAEIDAQLRAQAFEAALDLDKAALDRARQEQAAEQGRRADHAARARATLTADRELIKQRRNHAAYIRVERARRAFRRGRVWFRLAKPIGFAVGAAAVFAGAGLTTVVVAVIIARTAAKAAADSERWEGRRLIADRPEAKAAGAAYDDLFARVRVARTFDFKSIPRHGRTAVGALYRAASENSDIDPAILRALDEIAPGLSSRVIDLARYGLSVKVGDVCRAMFDPDDPKHRRALAAFVANPRPPIRRPPVRSRGRGIGD